MTMLCLLAMTMAAMSTMSSQLVVLTFYVEHILVSAHDVAQLLAVSFLEGLHLGMEVISLTFLVCKLRVLDLRPLVLRATAHLIFQLSSLGAMSGHLVLLACLQLLDLLYLLGWQAHLIDEFHIHYRIMHGAMLLLYLMGIMMSVIIVLVTLGKRGGGGECDAEYCGKYLLHNSFVFNCLTFFDQQYRFLLFFAFKTSTVSGSLLSFPHFEILYEIALSNVKSEVTALNLIVSAPSRTDV